MYWTALIRLRRAPLLIQHSELAEKLTTRADYSQHTPKKLKQRTLTDSPKPSLHAWMFSLATGLPRLSVGLSRARTPDTGESDESYSQCVGCKTKTAG